MGVKVDRYGVELHPEEEPEGQTWVTEGDFGPLLILAGTDWTDDQLLRALVATRVTLDAALTDMVELSRSAPPHLFRQSVLALARSLSDRSPVPATLLPRARA